MLSKCRILVTVFWGRHSVLLVDLMLQGTMINSYAYCTTVKKLRRAIQNKRCGMLSKGFYSSPTTWGLKLLTKLVTSFGWDILNHPPYSPNLAWSNLRLFWLLKNHFVRNASEMTKKWKWSWTLADRAGSRLHWRRFSKRKL